MQHYTIILVVLLVCNGCRTNATKSWRKSQAENEYKAGECVLDGKSRGLEVDQELHDAAARIRWSVCRAA